MRFTLLLQTLSVVFAGLSQAAPAPHDSHDHSEDLSPRALEKRAPCNTPSNRACWTTNPNFNINTDYETSVPNTGVTRKYTLVVSELQTYVGGDGITKKGAMLINGTYPGPTIKADWGDWIEVTVVNALLTNGTSFHWHGVRMLNNAVNDGANGVTECPIPPGNSKKYRFRAEQYGTSWYHSHFSSQYANGVVGSIQIEGPASLPYDIDLGVFPITDWYYNSSDSIQHSLIPFPGAAPASDNILFNGTHVNAQGGGSYNRVVLTPGKRHRLRIINPSVDNTFTVSLVDHDMTVIQTDFVPVNAFTTQSIFLGVGQRYDVTIDASKPVGNYWFNVTFSVAPCGTSSITNIRKPAAIFQYRGAPATLPTKVGTTPVDSFCADNTQFTPVITRSAPQNQFTFNASNDLDLTLTQQQWEGVSNRVYWKIKGQDMNITWDEPTLEYIAKGNMNFPARYNLFQVPQTNQWSFWVIENLGPIPHPMHLHGHDFLVLGKSPPQQAPFGAPIRRFSMANDLSSLRFNNPVRRDVTMLPSNGWLVVAFKSDNPGAWLFHCHIAWHVSQGLSVQFLERVQDIPSTLTLADIKPNCDAWEAYYPTSPHKQYDSGL